MCGSGVGVVDLGLDEREKVKKWKEGGEEGRGRVKG